MKPPAPPRPVSELLAGIRVIESAVLFNGDTLGGHLGDLGADVIKVESPTGGDYLRHMLGQVTPGRSPAHLQVNRGKRSFALDLRSDEGRKAFWDLHATADVFIDGTAGDALDRLGIGYPAQRQRKPDIVYCQYSGYGSTVPIREHFHARADDGCSGRGIPALHGTRRFPAVVSTCRPDARNGHRR